ncbi:MAG: hypothetical protein LC104_09395 [Bacteroidales bacterium]|nr:hypothetical protein [Bacteroidales bacterium]
MTPPPSTPAPDDPLDRAVRAHLDQIAETVDASAMWVRVRAARMAQTQPHRRSRGRVWLVPAGITTIAAGLLIAFILGEGPEPQPITAAQLVRQARATHAGTVDRCYEVVAEWDPSAFAHRKLEKVVRTSQLWTRGDPFWIRSTNSSGQSMAWGQDRQGRVWVAPGPGPERGMIFEPEELGEPLTRYCELMSLRFVQTLGELLEQYDLFRRDTGQPGEPIRIDAALRPSPGRPLPRYSQVELEMDPQTQVVNKAILRREFRGKIVGTLTFTLRETTQLSDDQYTLHGHLAPDAVVLDHSTAANNPADQRARADVLRRLRFQAGVRR